jgi:hypothetical protein
MHLEANEVRSRAILMQEMVLIQEANKREEMSVRPLSASLMSVTVSVDQTNTTSQPYDLTGRHLRPSSSGCRAPQYSTSSRDSRGATPYTPSAALLPLSVSQLRSPSREPDCHTNLQHSDQLFGPYEWAAIRSSCSAVKHRRRLSVLTITI